MGRRESVLLGGLLLGLAACSSGGPPAPTVTVPPFPSTVTTPTPLAPPSVTPTVPPSADPLAFFRDQQAGCRAHAQQTANPEVEPDRFSGAKRVRSLGGGATLIEDGRGTRLVVEVAKGIVLPPSGKETDAMPAPYAFGCSEKVFQGANAD